MMECTESHTLGLLTKAETQAERQILIESAKDTQDLTQILAQ